MVSGVFRSIASSDEIPRPIQGVDVTKLSLSAEEGFVYSRVDGKTPVKALMALTGFADHTVAKALARLIEVGAIAIGDQEGKAQPAPARDRRNEPYGGMIFNVVDLNEEVDLTEVQKKRILYFEKHLDEWHHFELLGLGRGATDVDVRKAYFKASKEFHPDAYFRRNLGSYAARIDRIFKRMKMAYDVLANPKTRQEYEENIVWPLTPEEEAELMEMAHRKEREVKRKELVKSRRLKRNPMLQRIKRAKELYALGIEAIQADRWIDAANNLRMAVSFDASRPEYQHAYAEAADKANRIRGLNGLRAVEAALETGVAPPEAVEDIERAIETAPDDAQVLAQASQLLLVLREVRLAFDTAQRAVAHGASSRAALMALAQAAERAEKWNIALRSIEKLLAMEPKSSELKDWLKQIKKKL